LPDGVIEAVALRRTRRGAIGRLPKQRSPQGYWWLRLVGCLGVDGGHEPASKLGDDVFLYDINVVTCVRGHVTRWVLHCTRPRSSLAYAFLVGLRLELDFESSSFIMGISEAI